MKRHLRALTRHEEESGQALVEAAFIFVIVLLLLVGLVEFGWAYFHYLAMQNAAGEGAAYGIIYSSWQQGTDPADTCTYNPDPNNIVYRVRNESKNDILDWSTALVDVDAPFITPGNPITVTVTYDHDLITPLLSPWVGDGTITLQATAVQTILSPPPECTSP